MGLKKGCIKTKSRVGSGVQCKRLETLKAIGKIRVGKGFMQRWKECRYQAGSQTDTGDRGRELNITRKRAWCTKTKTRSNSIWEGTQEGSCLNSISDEKARGKKGDLK